jgi:hypothetical protein
MLINIIFFFIKKFICSSIVVVIVKKYFVILVQIIGNKVQHQSIYISILCFNRKNIFDFFFSSNYRLCDFCYEKLIKESLMSNYTILNDQDNDNEIKDDVDLKFEVRSERLIQPSDDQSLSQEQ